MKTYPYLWPRGSFGDNVSQAATGVEVPESLSRALKSLSSTEAALSLRKSVGIND